MNAPLAFFSAVDTGVTTNRFSQDMSMVDTDLSMALSNTVLTGFIAVGQAAIIATASPFIIIWYPVLIGVLYFIQKFYLRTSRQLRFLDLESKAPL
jgi:ATP-binding cassette subfamily C (CFTR/MRP) protein 1